MVDTFVGWTVLPESSELQDRRGFQQSFSEGDSQAFGRKAELSAI